MPRAAKKPASFADRIAAVASESPVQELADALGRLVSKRLQRRARRDTVASLLAAAGMGGGVNVPKPQRKRARRVGQYRSYVATAKTDISRSGTFRKYMIATIRAHTDTRSANRAHDNCDNPKFAKNRLDFNWAADNGFINWE